MRNRFKIPIIVFLIIIGLIFLFFISVKIETFLFLEDQRRIEENSPPIQIIGKVDYRPAFDNDEVYFIPELNELYKIEGTGMNKTWLYTSWLDDGSVYLTEELHEKKVQIKGVLKKDGNDYVLNGGIPIIIVHEIKILN